MRYNLDEPKQTKSEELQKVVIQFLAGSAFAIFILNSIKTLIF